MDSTAPALHHIHIAVSYKEAVIDAHSVRHSLNVLHHSLYLPDRINIFFLSGKPLFRGIVAVPVLWGSSQAVTHFFYKINDTERAPGIQHGLIVRLFPNVILFHKFFCLTFIHTAKVICVEAAVFPKVFFRTANLFPEILMLYGICQSASPPVCPYSYRSGAGAVFTLFFSGLLPISLSTSRSQSWSNAPRSSGVMANSR